MSLHTTMDYRRSIPLLGLVEEVCQPLTSRLVDQSVDLTIDIPQSETVTADRDLLGRAVCKLVLNALDSMPNGGTLVLTSAAGQQAVELEIADTGPALSEKEREQLFDLLPANVRRGTGWGLAVVHRIAELHGGSVTAANCPEGGVAFTLRIPRALVQEAIA